MSLSELAGHIPVFGSVINALAILLGTGVGLVFRSAIPQRINTAAFHVIGLFTLWLGTSTAGSTHNILILVVSLVLGTVAGELLDLDSQFRRGTQFLQQKIGTSGPFGEGFMAGTLLFCMGSMAILGSLEEGLGQWPKLLLTKSLMDGIASAAFAVSLGVGVALSAASVLLYQGAITLAAGVLAPYMSQPVTDEISAVGGVMLMGLALGILEIKQIKVMNMLPGLAVAALLASLFSF
ncbi:MAG: hypothetical protein CSA35_01480 [Dethiosulfovibrio peptidovorans]|nr:MAG: hypothetical protein CSA35_01480 [Dethiosulfovibrio peptidovorans]